MVVANSSRLRTKVRKAYESALEKVETITKTIEFYRDQDEPAFTRWMRLTFGPSIEQLRSLKQELDSIQRTMLEVERIALKYEVSLKRAYQFHLHPETAPKLPPGFAKHAPPLPNDSNFQRPPEADSSDTDEFSPEDFLDELMQLISAPPREDSRRMKEIYRILVRQLHPDAGAEGTEENMQLWHQCQAAYEEQNLARLETLLESIQGRQGASCLETPISEWMRRTAALKKKLSQLRAELRACKSSEAWGCATQTPSPKVQSKITVEIQIDIDHMRAEVDRARREFTRFVSRNQRIWKPTSRYTPLDDDCPF